MKKVVRLWKIGYIDKNNIHNSYIPSKEVLEKVSEILKQQPNHTNTLDFIWGPDINLEVIEYEVDGETQIEDIVESVLP